MIGEKRRKSKTDVTDLLAALFSSAEAQKDKPILGKGKYNKK